MSNTQYPVPDVGLISLGAMLEAARAFNAQPLSYQPTQPMPVNPAPNPVWISDETAYTSSQNVRVSVRVNRIRRFPLCITN